MRQQLLFLTMVLAAVLPAAAQDARGSITGKVLDPQGAVIPGAAITVTNLDTNVAIRTAANSTGYFEVNLLNPGTYSMTVEAAGFRTSVRKGLELNVAGRLDIEARLELGQVAETVEVTAAAPMIDTASASGGRVINNRDIMELPFNDLNPFVLSALAPGMQWTGNPEWRRPFDNNGASAFNTMGGVGTNEYTMDGAPVTGRNRTVGYVPPSDSVSEFKLETTPFDAAYGHTAGASINVSTKSGTNTLHGSLFDQHWQQRWNALTHFARLSHEDKLRRGQVKPGDPKQEPGRSNNFGGAIGGPVWIPKVFNGKDRLFFFVSYNGIYQRATDHANVNVPKESWRQGDFSDLLAIDAAKYTVYDPRSARQEGSRVVRTPFPGNKGIPVLNPMYGAYEKIYPTPNNVPGLVTPDGLNNYYPDGMRTVEDFNSIINRVDYNITSRQRIFGRWYRNQRWNGNGDWTYSTVPGLNAGGGVRNNKGLGASYIYTFTNSTMMDVGVFWNRYNHGNRRPAQLQFKPTDVGLPAYLDAKAGDYTMLPQVGFSSLESLNNSYPDIFARAGTGQLKVAFTTIRGNHTLKYAWEERRTWFTSSGVGNSAGSFTFGNRFVKPSDVDSIASSVGLEWAAFRMGAVSGISIDSNDSGFWSTPSRAIYLQDDWRVSRRLRLNLGLRYEREAGITERFNRGLSGEFLLDEKLPITDLVQAAYARSPLAERPAAQFQVLGGSAYLGALNKTFTNGTHHVLPRIGVVYEIDNKTVIRGGYGWYYDTLNANYTQGGNQYGYNLPTSTVISTDNGLTFCCGVGGAGSLAAGRTPLNDPFPVRADGTRFNLPYGNSLGAMALVGQSFTAYPRDFSPDWQQRWRIGLQRQLRHDLAIEVSYNGAYSRIWVPQNVNYLPSQYWATGNVRNQAVDDDMNRNVSNPFAIGNLSALQSSNPTLYNYLATQSSFMSSTIRKNRLLRAYPQMNGLSGLRAGQSFSDVRGYNRYNDLQVQLEKRFSAGFQTAVIYTHAQSYEADFYLNEFDARPSERPSDQVRPDRFAWSAIWELPFGKGRRWVQQSPLQHVVGGWQLSWIYQYQNGVPLSFGNRFFYGNLDNVGALLNHDQVHANDIHAWFNPNIAYKGAGAVPQNFQGFEGRSAMQPGSFHVRVFPTRMDALRTDGLRTWDVKVMRRFRVTEQLRFNFALDLLNATNHTNFGGPNTDPSSTNFGRVTSQAGFSRVMQFNLRVEF